MSHFLTLAETAFDGGRYITISTSFGEEWRIYPVGRDSPSAVWGKLQHITGVEFEYQFGITTDKKLEIQHLGSAGTYSLKFFDGDGAADTALSALFGFSSASITASAGVTITANTAITGHEMTHISAKMNGAQPAMIGHGGGAASDKRRGFTVEAVGTLGNCDSVITAITQNGYISIADTGGGCLPWTGRITSVAFTPANATHGRLEFDLMGAP